MGTRKIKKEILQLLKNQTWEEIQKKIVSHEPMEVVGPLFSGLCRIEPEIRWHAISSFGAVVPLLHRQDKEAARIIMRRFLWSLNDESGGIGWGAPESMAEIMSQSRQLYGEYRNMFISYLREDGPELLQDGNYLELPELQQGLLWGVGRLALSYDEDLRKNDVIKDVLPYLASNNYVVRAMAAWGLGNLRAGEAKKELGKLLSDTSTLLHYLNGSFVEKTVHQFATEALERITKE